MIKNLGAFHIKRKILEIKEKHPDSRSVVLHRNIVNVGYNIQTVSDKKHKLLIDYDTGKVNDTHALAPMVISCKDLLFLLNQNIIGGISLSKQAYETYKK